MKANSRFHSIRVCLSIAAMNTQKIAGSQINASRIIYGCMTSALPWGPERDAEKEKQGLAAFEQAVECGINLFDHADIYCSGKGEILFGEFLKANPGLREKIYVQTKCGIRLPNSPVQGAPHRLDNSGKHILSSVDASLKRLGLDYLDILLLHRPDALVEPEEVAAAFNKLYASGKVQAFGVSNHTAGQIALLRRFVEQPLVANQVRINLMHSHMFDEPQNYDQGGGAGGFLGTLEYCRLHDITLQAYSPLMHGRLSQNDLNERESACLKALQTMSAEKGVSTDTLLMAWLLRHPAKIQPIVGSCNIGRIVACCRADEVELTREEWYSLWVAARGTKLP
ncbi:MAG: aldo/keto reductase [Kiritimatiellaceae bacterium]|nr:aldo/keto reductase [Kiritimatiellaceae bacterium]